MSSRERGHRRRIPSVEALLRSEPGHRASATFGRALLRRTLTQALDEVRAQAEKGEEPPGDDVILARAAALASWAAAGLTRVVNATGVVLHAGLGRAPIPERATLAAARAARDYADLEIDRPTGSRADRAARAELLLTALTGAESALVVNNGAAALLLALAALARGKGVLVSRGELAEVAGEFRIPDIVAASGAKLVEVGTAARTRLSDYRTALGERAALVLKVHPGNYRVAGSVVAPSVKDLAGLAAKAGVPFLFDLGSGLLERFPGIPADEPAATDALEDGADLVAFSGDKLLGGPQAGMVLGRADLVERLRRNPIARAVRPDKMRIAALEVVLSHYASGHHSEVPVWQMLRETPDEIHHRAMRLAEALDGELSGAFVAHTESSVGSGAMPGYGMPSWAVEIHVPDPHAMAGRLLAGSPSVLCRVED
ncbi:MAG TPA: L-seryl-tRNA(Sec) selenium transferase, partial [Actinomycetota bacterium]